MGKSPNPTTATSVRSACCKARTSAIVHGMLEEKTAVGASGAARRFTNSAADSSADSAGMHGVETLSPRPGSSALVFGAGPTGLLLAQLIARGGAVSVTVAASSAFKLKRAEALGIDTTFGMDRADLAGDAAKLKKESGGFDIVVDATGSAAVSEQCVPLTRNGGTVMFYGVTEPEDLVRVSPYDVFRREITIKGSFAEINSFPAAIAALRTGRARTEGLITHRFALDDYADALDALRGDRTVHKIIIECWQY